MAAGMIREKQTCKIYGENTNIHLTTLPQKVQKEENFIFHSIRKRIFHVSHGINFSFFTIFTFIFFAFPFAKYIFSHKN